MDRQAFVDSVLGNRKSGGRYLEIGVRAGAVFWHVNARTRIGVDPAFLGRRLNWTAKLTPVKRTARLRRGAFLFRTTSDEFFADHGAFLARTPLDCVLVDGLHTADQAYRDVENSLRWLAPGGTIVMHDCNPPTETAGLPSLDEALGRSDFACEWNGDVWKAVVRLRTRPDLEVKVLDCDYGLGVVRRGANEARLSFTDEQIDSLTYADLESDRVGLLNLVDP